MVIFYVSNISEFYLFIYFITYFGFNLLTNKREHEKTITLGPEDFDFHPSKPLVLFSENGRGPSVCTYDYNTAVSVWL